MTKTNETVRIIKAVAPIRICDIGGWTDTQFAKHGKVLNIAVCPYSEVQCRIVSRDLVSNRVMVHAENFGMHFTVYDLDGIYNKLPLVEAAIHRMTIPEDLAIEVTIFCKVPPGASTGTSAAVSVSIIGALDRLTPNRLSSYEIVRLAHDIETKDLGLQSGIQDQLCSVYGGINFIDIVQFPHANVSPINLSSSLWWELEDRIVLVYVGSPHESSIIHQSVIKELGINAVNDVRLERLRKLAIEAKDAILIGDWFNLGRIMDYNTDIQRELHSDLVCTNFERVIEIAKFYDAMGCKVNGAGGNGGSITILGNGDNRRKRAMLAAIKEEGFIIIPLYLAHQGLRVWEFNTERLDSHRDKK